MAVLRSSRDLRSGRMFHRSRQRRRHPQGGNQHLGQRKRVHPGHRTHRAAGQHPRLRLPETTHPVLLRFDLGLHGSRFHLRPCRPARQGLELRLLHRQRPLGVTDLKAAVRYLRYNSASLPGAMDKMFVFGHSGGVQSSVMGASGDSPLYTRYLEHLGAAMTSSDGTTISDAIAGVMAEITTSLNNFLADTTFPYTLRSRRPRTGASGPASPRGMLPAPSRSTWRWPSRPSGARRWASRRCGGRATRWPNAPATAPPTSSPG